MKNLADVQNWLDHTKSISDFRLSVRAAVRGLWSGEFSYFVFVDSMRAAVERNLKIAWREGAANCGVFEDELTDGEIAARDRFINSQFPYLLGFADDIEAGSKRAGGLLEPQLKRAELWINRYDEAFEQAKAMACADQKGVWVLGKTDRHCASCKGLAGRVYRYSTWQANSALPRNRRLCCKGFRCQCRIEPTAQNMTKGRFPTHLLCNDIY